MSKPLLSIGIIFKNEIRCLERCLKSLQPLRDAIPCEVVVADTGADDGSREVAERYADILIDFPWIDDFSAARNAVMERCSGKWYMTMDADEWLDGDVSQIAGYLKDKGRKEDFCAVIVRNYTSYDFKGNYGDFLAVRMVRMSTGARYTGTIHEEWNIPTKSAFVLDKTILHHDGYVKSDPEQVRKKNERNMVLLREELKKAPNSLRRRLQCMESSAGDPDQDEYIRLAVEGVKEKLPDWEMLGPAIFRGAANWAAGRSLEELESIAEDAREWFPDSMFVRLDINFLCCTKYISEQNYEKAASFGDDYLRGMEDYHAGRCNMADMLMSVVGTISPQMESHIGLVVAECYFQLSDFQKSMDRLTAVGFEKLSGDDFRNCIGIMVNLHAQSGLELSGHMLKLWNYIEALDKKEPTTKKWMDALASVGGMLFPPEYRAAESEGGYRHAYTIFLPLRDKCELGIAAAVMEMYDPDEITAALSEVKDWDQISIYALVYGLAQGARFPVPDKPLNIEVMDGLAVRLAAHHTNFFWMALRAAKSADPADWQGFVWTLELMLAAVRTWSWENPEENEELGLDLARAFAGLEREFLSRSYTPEALREDRLFALPPMHRFGWYCAQAFAALDEGDLLTGVQRLRAGLSACEGMTKMVEFLQKRIGEMERASRIAEAPPELVELAERVKLLLARFAPDDPAVAELKKSPAYQQVAWLIEKPASMADTILQ